MQKGNIKGGSHPFAHEYAPRLRAFEEDLFFVKLKRQFLEGAFLKIVKNDLFFLRSPRQEALVL